MAIDNINSSNFYDLNVFRKCCRSENEEDEFQLDLTRDCMENMRDILTNICKKQGVSSERKRLSYLNAFVKLLLKSEYDYKQLGFTSDEILYCLRPALLHDTAQVRSGGLRALRYMLHSRHEAAVCCKLQYPLLIARCMDLITGNDNERVQAIRVVRRLLSLDPAQFPDSLARTLVAIASGTEDRLINVALGTLAELCVLSPDQMVRVGGVTTLLRSLANVRSARMAEALIGSLLFLINRPATRLRADLSLESLAAPYTELLPPLSTAPASNKENQSAERLKWAHLALVSTLRSWPGMLHFCHPAQHGLRSLIHTLYINQLDVRRAVLDLVFELLCLPNPEWTDDMSLALESVDPSRLQDVFKLNEGFVAAEGRAVLPHLSKCRVNLSELHQSLLLSCFLEAGLLDSLIEVIISEDAFLSVRATILLGELLHLIHLLLPPECCHLTPSLPNLLSYAVRGRPHSTAHCSTPSLTPNSSFNIDDLSTRMGVCSGNTSVRTTSESSEKGQVSNVSDPDKRLFFGDFSPYNKDRKDSTTNKLKSRWDKTAHLLKDVRDMLAGGTNTDEQQWLRVEPPHSSRAQQRALAAVTALSRLHRTLRRCPAPASLQLDHALAAVSACAPPRMHDVARSRGKTHSSTKLNQLLTKECDDAIRESQVLSNNDCFTWNWDIIRSILKSRPDCLRKCEETNHRQFMRRLVQFVSPSSLQMSQVELGLDRRSANPYTLTAIELLDCLLLAQNELECGQLLRNLLSDLKHQVEAVSSVKSPHDSLLSPQAVANTLCQDYFLLVGHLSRSRPGCDLLHELGITQLFLILSTTSKYDCYIKLIISCLDYSSDERIRNVMSSTLVCSQASSRLYATKFLRVLLRATLSRRQGYMQWVIELLANQLADENRAVALNALAALDEACDFQEYLETLIELRPSLLHLGDKGLLLLIRFLSTEKGFSYMSDSNFVSTQLSKWAKFNYKYVCIVEGELADGLTLVERNEDGRYSSRLSNVRRLPSDVYVPHHLYSQLARHQAGLAALLADNNVNRLLQVVLLGQCGSESEVLELKAALWALGHLSTSGPGAIWARTHSLTQAIVNLASCCPVYSVRSTAFHAIALTATNLEGADTLRTLGWHSVRHNRSQHWPVLAPLYVFEEAFFQFSNDKGDSSESTNTDSVTKNSFFILGEDTQLDDNISFNSFTARERSSREQKSATLPPSGSATHGAYHHSRSYSESKADPEWVRSPRPHNGSDIIAFSENATQKLIPIPSTGSLATPQSHRKISTTSSQGPHLSTQDAMGLSRLQNLHRSRRPSFFATPHLSLHFSQSVPTSSSSPLSPIELIAFQDWKQMSPLARPKHPENNPIEQQFEVRGGVHCPLLPDLSPPSLHYESSQSCIIEAPKDPIEEDSSMPCYRGICLPQHLTAMFPVYENHVKSQDPIVDNNSSTGMDVSSCDSETDTALEGGAENDRRHRPSLKRRHNRDTCLLCSVSGHASAHQPRWRKISAGSQHRTRTETESSYGGGGGLVEGESPLAVPWQSKGLEGITSIDSSSTDITSAAVAQRLVGESFKSRSVVRKEVLRLSEQLCNPILYKTCKQALLQLKQTYGDVFNDICVYSDVCAVMASASHKICARRFLQELFLDAPFSEVYEDPLKLLSGQTNGESDDGACCEKQMASLESTGAEEVALDASSWKLPSAKLNAFEGEQRTGQGYELEVILESDVRSESSNVFCGLVASLSNPDKNTFVSTAPPNQHSPVTHADCNSCPSHPSGLITSHDISVKLNQNKPSSVDTTIEEEIECCITVSRSSQQLRKEFFSSSMSSKSSFETDMGPVATKTGNVGIECDDSFVLKVADSISKSQGKLDLKHPLQDVVKDQYQSFSVPDSSHPKVNESLVNTESSGPNQNKSEIKCLNQESNSFSEVRYDESIENPSQQKGKIYIKSEQDTITLESSRKVNKSSQFTQRIKKTSNAMSTGVKSKYSPSSIKQSNEIVTNTLEPPPSNMKAQVIDSSKLAKDIASYPVAGKKEVSKPLSKQRVMSESSTEASASSSRGSSKLTKSKTTEPSGFQKPPSGPGKQRKKTSKAKTPSV